MTSDGTATLGDNDYFYVENMLTIPAGQLSATIDVNARGDLKDEPNEPFFVNLLSPTNATITDNQGKATIVNDD
jgi:hypothetical protein